jgi:SAM-dependent methyltransferase
MALPFPADRFDAAVMALVIFFVPDPAKGVAEMARVVRPGGIVCAYAWDMLSGGFPFEPIRAEMRTLGREAPLPPSPDASRLDALRDLWTAAGLEAVETREITVRRTYDDFDHFWNTTTGMGSTRATLAGMDEAAVARFKDGVRARLPAGERGTITYGARANAVKGRVAQGPGPRHLS